MDLIEGIFPGSFFCTILPKDFPEKGYNVREVLAGRRRTRGDYFPAHIPAMKPDKALASGCEKRAGREPVGALPDLS